MTSTFVLYLGAVDWDAIESIVLHGLGNMLADPRAFPLMFTENKFSSATSKAKVLNVIFFMISFLFIDFSLSFVPCSYLSYALRILSLQPCTCALMRHLDVSPLPERTVW